MREQYDSAVAEKRSAEMALTAAPSEVGESHEELESYIEQVGDVAKALNKAEPEELTELYASLRLSLT